MIKQLQEQIICDVCSKKVNPLKYLINLSDGYLYCCTLKCAKEVYIQDFKNQITGLQDDTGIKRTD